jgi:hypothetical protein
MGVFDLPTTEWHCNDCGGDWFQDGRPKHCTYCKSENIAVNWNRSEKITVTIVDNKPKKKKKGASK